VGVASVEIALVLRGASSMPRTRDALQSGQLCYKKEQGYPPGFPPGGGALFLPRINPTPTQKRLRASSRGLVQSAAPAILICWCSCTDIRAHSWLASSLRRSWDTTLRKLLNRSKRLLKQVCWNARRIQCTPLECISLCLTALSTAGFETSWNWLLREADDGAFSRRWILDPRNRVKKTPKGSDGYCELL